MRKEVNSGAFSGPSRAGRGKVAEARERLRLASLTRSSRGLTQ